MNYSVPDTQVQRIDGIEPFTLVTDIDNARGIVRIAGFAQKEPTPGSTTKMATVFFSGKGRFDLVVSEILDYNVQPISFSNPTPDVLTTKPTDSAPTAPPYNIAPRYPNSPTEQPLSLPGGPGPYPYQTQNPLPDQSAVITQGTPRTSGSIPVIQETQRILPSQVPVEPSREQNQAEPSVSTAPQQQALQQKTPVPIGLSIIGLTIVFFIYQKRYL